MVSAQRVAEGEEAVEQVSGGGDELLRRGPQEHWWRRGGVGSALLVLDGARQGGGEFRARVLGSLGDARHTVEAGQVRGRIARYLPLQGKKEVECGSCERLRLNDASGQDPGAVDGVVAQGPP